MKKYLTLIFCSVALAWSGCSENDAPVNTANLTGKWECYKSYDAEYDEWDYDYGEGIDIYRLEFRPDNTCHITDDSSSADLLYRLEGRTIILYEEAYPDEEEKIRINRLTPSELALAYDHTGDNRRKCTDLENYKRID